MFRESLSNGRPPAAPGAAGGVLPTLEKDKLDAKHEIRRVLDAYRENPHLGGAGDQAMWGYTNDLLDDFRCRLHFREGRFFQEKEETVTSGIRDERDRPSSAAQLERAVTYEISDDRRKVRMLHPSLQVAGAEPVSIYMDMDAAAVDALLRQVAEIRAQDAVGAEA